MLKLALWNRGRIYKKYQINCFHSTVSQHTVLVNIESKEFHSHIPRATVRMLTQDCVLAIIWGYSSNSERLHYVSQNSNLNANICRWEVGTSKWLLHPNATPPPWWSHSEEQEHSALFAFSCHIKWQTEEIMLQEISCCYLIMNLVFSLKVQKVKLSETGDMETNLE